MCGFCEGDSVVLCGMTYAGTEEAVVLRDYGFDFTGDGAVIENKYIKEAFTKFVAILNTPADTVPAKEEKEHEQQPVSDVFQDQPEPDQPQES